MTKIYYNGKRLNTPWNRFKHTVKVIANRILLIVILTSIIVGIFEAGAFLNPKTIYTQAEVIKEVEASSPVLDRIAGCESEGNPKSKGSHYDRNGQVRLNANTNKSVDIGIMQINNQAWGKKATELGYNLMIEEDNKAMGKWIYANRGTQDWYSSKTCWMK